MSDAVVENPHAGQGMVVLDIGGDVGALMVAAPASLAGAEIEICPTGARTGVPDEGAGWWQGSWRSHSHDAPGGGHTHGGPVGGHTHGGPVGGGHGDAHAHSHSHGPAWPHVGVLARPTGNGRQYCAVFPGLRDGTYDLWLRPDEPTALTATVRGGEVTWAHWPARPCL